MSSSARSSNSRLAVLERGVLLLEGLELLVRHDRAVVHGRVAPRVALSSSSEAWSSASFWAERTACRRAATSSRVAVTVGELTSQLLERGQLGQGRPPVPELVQRGVQILDREQVVERSHTRTLGPGAEHPPPRSTAVGRRGRGGAATVTASVAAGVTATVRRRRRRRTGRRGGAATR